MTGGRKYTKAQIEWVLDSVLAGHSGDDIVAEYRHKFNHPEWSKAQLKYVKNTYGDHPDFGCRLPNRGITTTAAQAKAAVDRLAQRGQGDSFQYLSDQQKTPALAAHSVSPQQIPEIAAAPMFGVANQAYAQQVTGNVAQNGGDFEFLDFTGAKTEPDFDFNLSHANHRGTTATAYTDPNTTAAVVGPETFPLPDHSMVDNQSGPLPLRPTGCTKTARTGWDQEGWWYRGEHDGCLIPTVHRHDTRGHLTFAGFNDILQLVLGIIERSQAAE
ncbi:hypothetical protein SCUP234_09265 [Seiridium cupressi]